MPTQDFEVSQLEEAFEQTGVRFHDIPATLAAFRAGRAPIEHTEAGAFATYDGLRLPLKNALLRFAYDNRDAIDARTLPRTGADASRPGLASKADHKTAAEKSAFIGRHGLDAWERLPLTGVATSEVLTQQDWHKLPRAEKVRRIAADPNAFSKLAPAPPTTVAGAYIAHDKLAKIKAVRPGGRLG